MSGSHHKPSSSMYRAEMPLHETVFIEARGIHTSSRWFCMGVPDSSTRLLHCRLSRACTGNQYPIHSQMGE